MVSFRFVPQPIAVTKHEETRIRDTYLRSAIVLGHPLSGSGININTEESVVLFFQCSDYVTAESRGTFRGSFCLHNAFIRVDVSDRSCLLRSSLFWARCLNQYITEQNDDFSWYKYILNDTRSLKNVSSLHKVISYPRHFMNEKNAPYPIILIIERVVYMD